MFIVGIDIGGANDTTTVDHKPARHRQGPTLLTVANGELRGDVGCLEIFKYPQEGQADAPGSGSHIVGLRPPVPPNRAGEGGNRRREAPAGNRH